MAFGLAQAPAQLKDDDHDIAVFSWALIHALDTHGARAWRIFRSRGPPDAAIRTFFAAAAGTKKLIRWDACEARRIIRITVDLLLY